MTILLIYALKAKQAIRRACGVKRLVGDVTEKIGLRKRYETSRGLYRDMLEFHDRFFSPMIYPDAKRVLGASSMQHVIASFGEALREYEQALTYSEYVLDNIEFVSSDDVTKAAAGILESDATCDKSMREIQLETYKALELEYRNVDTAEERDRYLFVRDFVYWNCEDICNRIGEYRRKLLGEANDTVEKIARKYTDFSLWDLHI